jgi:putative phage-type endonuclease
VDVVTNGRRVTPTGTLVLRADAPRAEWLEARRYRAVVPGGYCIGSSDVPSILDLPGVDTPAHVWHAKVNSLEKEQTDAMRFGQLFEPVIADDWAARNHAAIRRIGIVANIAEPWHQTSLDRAVTACPLRIGGGCSLEIKNVGEFAYKIRWHHDLPDYILAQMLHQLLVTGYSHSHYAVCVGGNQPHQGVVYADRERDLMEYIRTGVNRFRADYLLAGIEPPWTAGQKVDRYLELDAQVHAERVGEIGIDGLDAVLEYAGHSIAEGKARTAKKAAKLKLARLAAGHRFVKLGDDLVFQYRDDPYTWTDLERLAEKYPEVYADPEVVHHKTKTVIAISNTYRKMAEES